jgi:hypothetical protein
MIFKGRTLVAVAVMAFALVAVDVSAQEGLSERSLRKMSRGTARAGGGLKAVCRNIRGVSNEFLYKSQISNHISAGDPRASGPTLVCNRACPSFPASVLYSDGSLATRVGYYGRWNVTGKARAYCGAGGVPVCSNATLARNSRARGRDGKLYVKIGSTCYRVNPVGRTGTPT